MLIPNSTITTASDGTLIINGAGPTTAANITFNQGYVWNQKVQIGNGFLEEINDELWWVRQDGSRTCLTGKSNNFKSLYEKLDGDDTK